MGVIAAITLSVLGFIFVMVFLSRTTDGKEFYCTNLKPLLGKLGAQSDEICTSIQKLESEFGKHRNANLSIFQNKNIRDLFSVNESVNATFVLNLSRDAIIRNATMAITNANPIARVTKFNDQDYRAILTYDFIGGTQTLKVNVTPKSLIKRARLKVEGYNVPGRIDIVFVIDQSGSMWNEWSDICGSIADLKRNLSETGLGVDVSSTIYGLSDSATSTTGSCKYKDITTSQLKTAITQLGSSFVPSAPVEISYGIYRFPAYDSVSEAWGVGTFWAVQEHPWRQNTKKIIFPVSDSDPTGGGPAIVRGDATGRPIEFLAEPLFSGNEQAVVSGADSAAQAAGVYLFPIYGDENPAETDVSKIEGYHVGTGSTTCDPNLDPQCGCAPQFNAVCKPIIDWMRELARYPQSRLTGYRNPDSLKRFAQFVLRTDYPHDVTIKVNGQQIFYQEGVLDSINSPQWVNEPAFITALQDASDACAQPVCTVDIDVSSTTEGAVILSDLDIVSQQYISGVAVELNGQSIYSSARFTGNERIEFTSTAQDVMASCVNPDCFFNFTVSAQEKAKLLLTNLSITYSKLFLNEDILDMVLECDARAKADRYTKKIRCAEFSIPQRYIFYRDVNESSITQVIKARKWCSIFGNADSGCGTADQLRLAQPFTVPTNVLIEFDPSFNQVVVS